MNQSDALFIQNLSKTFVGQAALTDFSISIPPGAVHALVGENGSGKSTFVKILAGYHRPDPGAEAHALGTEFDLGSSVSARQAGMRFVHQDLGIVDDLSVADNFHLNLDRKRRIALNRRREHADAERALADLGFPMSGSAKAWTLTESERTAIAVARALSIAGGEPHLMVLDEPTASMSRTEAQRLFRAVRQLASRGVATLYISHHLHEVLDVADVVTVLRDGRRIATERASDLDHERLIELMLGRRLAAASRNRSAAPAPQAQRVLKVEGLGGESLGRVDFSVGPGEILGIAGLSGSGREEVASLLSGNILRRGVVKVNGRPVVSGNTVAAIRAGLVCVPAERARLALLPNASVRENLTLPDTSEFTERGCIRRRRERSATREWIGKLTIRPGKPEAPIQTLSGGNQQKVVLARWLRLAPTVLVLDEPTQGIDVGAKADIYRLIEASRAGIAILVCSSDAEELARLCDSVLFITDGRASGYLTGDEITAEAIEEQLLRSVEWAKTEECSV